MFPPFPSASHSDTRAKRARLSPIVILRRASFARRRACPELVEGTPCPQAAPPALKGISATARLGVLTPHRPVDCARKKVRGAVGCEKRHSPHHTPTAPKGTTHSKAFPHCHPEEGVLCPTKDPMPPSSATAIERNFRHCPPRNFDSASARGLCAEINSRPGAPSLRSLQGWVRRCSRRAYLNLP